MDFENLSHIFFTITFFIYGLTFMVYILMPVLKSEGFKKTGTVLMITAFSFHTIGLALRWIASGFDHPPMTNIYESLLFFVWGIVLVYICFERKYKINFAGLFVMLIVIVAMGLASLSPDKSIKPLIPALKSLWLHVHVFFAGISYAFFLMSAVFAILFMVKHHRMKPLTGFMFDFFSFFCLILSGQGSIFLLKSFGLNKLEYVNGKLFPVKEIIEIPGINILFLILTIAFIVDLISLLKEHIRGKDSPGFISKKISFFCFFLFLSLIIWLSGAFYFVEGISPFSTPYILGILALGFASTLIHRIINLSHNFILSSLPGEKILDFLSYHAIIIALPLLTIVIVTGSVWAHYAWGRYWGWDPKETWSLITWFIYAIYLHLRLQKSWTGQKSAIISIFGFMAVVFTYLGVNILLSGLHSYG